MKRGHDRILKQGRQNIVLEPKRAGDEGCFYFVVISVELKGEW